jgi:hypothetical protein
MAEVKWMHGRLKSFLRRGHFSFMNIQNGKRMIPFVREKSKWNVEDINKVKWEMEKEQQSTNVEENLVSAKFCLFP